MNKKVYITLAISALFAFFAGCTKQDYDNPPAKEYVVDTVFFGDTVAYSVIGIAELKKKFPGYPFLIDSAFAIKGTVISDDSHGNFYKEISLQDSTGGIEIQIENSDLKDYLPGQLLYVKCKGLVISDYRGTLQLNFLSNEETVRLPLELESKFLFKSSGGENIEPNAKQFDELTDDDINTLVRFEGVEFISSDTSKTFSSATTTSNRYIQDLAGNQLTVRTSNFADFALDSIPNGNGSIVGVYSVYNGEGQIFIRDANDVQMTGKRITKVLDEQFTSNIGTFSQYSVSGSKTWSWSSAGGKEQYMVMNGYNNGVNEDWLISPVVDLSEISKAILSFSHAANYVNGNWDNLTVLISSDYDSGNPNSATWTPLTGWGKSDGSSWTFVDSGGLDVSDFKGNARVHVAFKYLCGTSNAPAWEITWVSIATVQ